MELKFIGQEFEQGVHGGGAPCNINIAIFVKIREIGTRKDAAFCVDLAAGHIVPYMDLNGITPGDIKQQEYHRSILTLIFNHPVLPLGDTAHIPLVAIIGRLNALAAIKQVGTIQDKQAAPGFILFILP